MNSASSTSNSPQCSDVSKCSDDSKCAATDWLFSNFTNFEKSLNGGAKLPLHSKRKAALAEYNRIGFPNSTQEDWKYTNPSPIQEKAFALIPTNQKTITTTSAFDKYCTSGLDSIKVVIRNGQQISSSTCPAGLNIYTLEEAQKGAIEISSLLEKHLAEYAKTDQAFVAINTSLLENAIIIRVQSGVQISNPIELLFINDEASTEKTILPRVLIVAERSSQATVIERYISTLENEYCTNSVVEFALEENSTLNHYRIQSESTEAFHVSTIAAALEANTNFSTHTFSFGGKLVRNDVNITLNGSNCNVVMNGLTAINGKQHVDNHTLLDNTKPNCESNELYKGVYADSSEGVFSGSIIVRQDAQKTNAIQSNKSLLLSDQAIVNTKPQLKIWADDVKCTHGATIGQLDEDAMFYIRSRGVSEKDARVILIHAFASEVISTVKIPALRENLEQLLLEKLKLEQ